MSGDDEELAIDMIEAFNCLVGMAWCRRREVFVGRLDGAGLSESSWLDRAVLSTSF